MIFFLKYPRNIYKYSQYQKISKSTKDIYGNILWMWKTGECFPKKKLKFGAYSLFFSFLLIKSDNINLKLIKELIFKTNYFYFT